MELFTIQKAKANLSRLIERACRGEEIVIARGKKPVARLVPIEEAQRRSPRKPGAWKGKIHVEPGCFEPLSDEELEAWGL